MARVVVGGIEDRLESKLDASVNWVLEGGVEARYVQRVPEYFIVYLSSHDGCNKACRFCHLTQTGQTAFNEVGLEGYVAQAKVVLAHYDELVVKGMVRAGHVNFNLMARGEPLANGVVLTQLRVLEELLGGLAEERGLTFKVNVSSIVPMEAVGRGLVHIFEGTKHSQLFYSLYSADEGFRRRWLPKAAGVDEVLGQIRELQSVMADFGVVLHWGLIEGENDGEGVLERIGELVRGYGIRARFNLVRYNPYSEGQGKESLEGVLKERLVQIERFMEVSGSRIVPKVGFDVKASCGMFVSR